MRGSGEEGLEWSGVEGEQGKGSGTEGVGEGEGRGRSRKSREGGSKHLMYPGDLPPRD